MNSPSTPEATPIAALSAIITGSRSVSRRAAAAGVTSIATTRMLPTARSDTTIVSEISTSSSRSSQKTRQAHRLGGDAVERRDQQLVVEEQDQRDHDDADDRRQPDVVRA